MALTGSPPNRCRPGSALASPDDRAGPYGAGLRRQEGFRIAPFRGSHDRSTQRHRVSAGIERDGTGPAAPFALLGRRPGSPPALLPPREKRLAGWPLWLPVKQVA